MKIFTKLLNYFGFYNLETSKKYRFVKELYDETSTMIKIQPLVETAIKNYYEANSVLDFENTAPIVQKPKLFQYWHQGFNELPGLVKNCYKSVDFFLGDDFEIIRIELKTLSNFIRLPEHILQARNEEKMTIAHFSDIIRNKLLLEYGGMWLDSSVLLTGKKDIQYFTSLENRLMFSRFVFSNPKEHAVQFESWIMWSRDKGNLVYQIADEVLSQFWSKNENVGNYFLYHIILTNIFLLEKRFKMIFNWNDRIYLGNSLDLGHYLVGEKFDITLLEGIMRKTNIHKLDFKLQHPNYGTFGDYFGKDVFTNYILN